MPGLTLQITAEAVGPIAVERYRSAQASMVHSDHYKAEVQLAEGGILLGHVAYHEYPMAFFRRAGLLIALEGRIYNHSNPMLEGDLCELAIRISRDPGRASERVREWILGHDGEYVCAIVSPDRQRVWAFCDPLGRLPLYYQSGENGLWLARECKFILCSREVNRWDPIAWAQCLWMGYPFGRRTLFADVMCTPPAMLLSAERVAEGKLRTRIEQLFELNLDEKDGDQRSAIKSGQDLAEMFIESVRARGSDTPMNVISLSGGQDSRAVAVAMTRAGVPCVAATFLTADGRGKVDAPVAGQIARELKIPWELIHVPAQTGRDEDRLVHLKDGLNYVGMAFILRFMDAIAAKWGRTAYYVTGDGGDKALPDLTPTRKPRSFAELLEVIRRIHCPYTSNGLVEQIMGIDAGSLLESLSQVVTQYPEAELQQRAVHFAYGERARRWLFEGEDRARFFLWQTSPFYSLEFFRSAMQVPDRLKKYNQLFRYFQMNLSPAVARISDPKIGLGMASPWYGASQRAHAFRQYVPLAIKKQLKRLTKLKSHQVLLDLSHLSSDRGIPVSPGPLCSFLQMGETQVYLWRTLERLHELWPDTEFAACSPRPLETHFPAA